MLILIGILLSFPISFLWNQENTLTSDFVLNDLYYQLRDSDSTWAERAEKKNQGISGKIIFINSTNLVRNSNNRDSFRYKLSRVLDEITKYQPAVVAIDHVFENLNDTASEINNKLVRSLINIPYLVLDERNKKEIPIKTIHFGKTVFPSDQNTIRRYFSDSSTFAYKIVNGLLPNQAIRSFNDTSFIINYLSNNYMDLDLHVIFEPNKLSNVYYTYIDAERIDENDTSTLKVLPYIKGNAVIIGHLGPREFSQYDIEDKHFVPLDTALIRKSHIMYGAVIHANAAENIMNPNIRFNNLHDKFWSKIIKEFLILIFIAFLLFFKLGKLINLLIIFVSSIIMVYIVLFLMKHQVYLEAGFTLIQFLIFDELIELLLPIYNKLLGKFENK
jgi:CHASE2 domain-containing sensor protein